MGQVRAIEGEVGTDAGSRETHPALGGEAVAGEHLVADVGAVERERVAAAIAQGRPIQVDLPTDTGSDGADLALGCETFAGEDAAADVGAVESERVATGIAQGGPVEDQLAPMWTPMARTSP